jgi:hypothetical protein
MATGLQIKPHSHRLSGLAVAGLSLLAAGSFVAGIQREVAGAGGPSPFPATQAAAPVAGAIPEARPAPEIQVAASPPPRPHAVAPADDTPADTQDTPTAAVAAETPPAVDTAAAVPEPAPSPAPAPEANPDTSTPPT